MGGWVGGWVGGWRLWVGGWVANLGVFELQLLGYKGRGRAWL